MSERELESVRSFRSWLRTPARIPLLVLAVLVFLYALLIEGAILLGIIADVTILAVPWWLHAVRCRTRAFERIADAQQRRATLREREAGFERGLSEE